MDDMPTNITATTNSIVTKDNTMATSKSTAPSLRTRWVPPAERSRLPDPNLTADTLEEISISKLRRSVLSPMATPGVDSYVLNTPPEIRNRIYEYVFEVDTTELVNLRETSPPSKSLTLTFRQVFNETSRMQMYACRKYWSQNEFTILHAHGVTSRLERDAIYSDINKLHDLDLAHIREMTLEGRAEGLRCFWRSGIWYCCIVPKDCAWKLMSANLRCSRAQVDALRAAGATAKFDTLPKWGGLWQTNLAPGGEEAQESIDEARRILGAIGLSKQNLMVTMRIIMAD